MNILITNDDGITDPGLLALVREISSLGKVVVLAPDRNWSASGHVKTMHRPLRVKEVELTDGTVALTSDGAPSDCVALALLGLLPEPIDMVISGINSGANVGHDVTYSGTVTAAMEAAIGGVPGIAVSLDTPDDHPGEIDYGPAARVGKRVTQYIIQNNIPSNLLLNVNVPFLPEDKIKGFMVTRQGMRVYRDRLDKRLDPRGRPYYWIGGDTPTGIPNKGTDFGALSEGYVSITPLHLDLTAYKAMEILENWDL
jgi:5'-nucleotidase